MTNLESYHAFLIRNRIYCEHAYKWYHCANKAETVENINGRDTVLCRKHSDRLNHTRKSDKLQYETVASNTYTITTKELKVLKSKGLVSETTRKP